MRLPATTALLATLALGAPGCRQEHPMDPTTVNEPTTVPSRAEDVRPLDIGQAAPTAVLRDAQDRAVNLSDLYAQRPTVLIFYRGGWCPYCNTHLGQIAMAEPQLIALGYQVLAISPDQPLALRASVDKSGYAYRLLSDSDMVLTRGFGLAFRVDGPTVEKYRGFGIDLAAASGRSHHLLPVPAVYIVDKRGVIRFAHWDADYKKRLEPAQLLDEAGRVAER